MAITHITKQNFKEEVLQSDLPVLVDFWAPWCGPCRMLAPVLEELDGELAGKVKVAKVNVDEEMDLAAQFQVASIPTLILFRDGQAVRRSVGAQPKERLAAMCQ